MTKRAAFILILLIILLSAGAYFALRGSNEAVTPAPSESEMIRITAPASGGTVSSPLTVTGEARGNWYFEASFPVRVIDANGRELGIAPIQAQGEWMTTNFVPFSGSVSFATSTTATGFVVFEKDNPSGLPENDAEVRVPVRFSQSSASKTPIQDAVRTLLAKWNLPGVTLEAASLNNGVLTLTFSDPQHKTSGGSARVTMMREEIEATAKQFSGVNSVRLMPEELFQP